MVKRNYHKELLNILSTIDKDNKPTLLLHACCAPCSSYVIEFLAKYFQITIFYYNPNIHPKQEYDRRLSELKRFLMEFPEAIKNQVNLITCNYDPQDYFNATRTLIETELQLEKEKGERCRRCYEFRMKAAYEYAKQHNFDYFTTTLSISPFKDSEKINTIGFQLNSPESCDTKFLQSDFKKNSGFLRSLELSKEFNLFRQNYCGCIYSLKNKNN